ncbi:N-acetylmuramic acid 6-phosphate etherase [Thermosediminibacter oceani]|uniref:N-acetylmuramic acid 6-phosphate etherase n=1 Tax=Thermosediminibacter oceani (strain ATCC BAA-1034 / DSM 16646 / JW/IW-1228P) TaxID=555079 RepID=D9S0W1_THEOJ|nr:N-acetylmuramic acid 6-phosphate etherase [Thermosediminibacter oceani]ADL07125.1 glucokinase regulatory-like protein [Thermosediminibacter oceani DSM 16646]
MELTKLITEQRNPYTEDIDILDTVSMLKKMNDEDKKVAFAVEKEIPRIATAVDLITNRLKNGGRLIYIGAGTSGRLGILDASECPPTFGVDPELVQGVIAGGDSAIKKAVEGAEDDEYMGRKDLQDRRLSDRDVVAGLTASGRTPYVIGGLKYAREVGALTIGICCNPESPLRDFTDILIAPVVGPEVILGSTRLKAGTAQKMVLNMISTGVMIRLGKVYSNLMVDLQATNKKLQQRARRIVKLATGVDDERIDAVLSKTEYNVKLSIFMILSGMDGEKAKKILTFHGGNIRKALESIEGVKGVESCG